MNLDLIASIPNKIKFMIIENDFVQTVDNSINFTFKSIDFINDLALSNINIIPGKKNSIIKKSDDGHSLIVLLKMLTGDMPMTNHEYKTKFLTRLDDCDDVLKSMTKHYKKLKTEIYDCIHEEKTIYDTYEFIKFVGMLLKRNIYITNGSFFKYYTMLDVKEYVIITHENCLYTLHKSCYSSEEFTKYFDGLNVRQQLSNTELQAMKIVELRKLAESLNIDIFKKSKTDLKTDILFKYSKTD